MFSHKSTKNRIAMVAVVTRWLARLLSTLLLSFLGLALLLVIFLTALQKFRAFREWVRHFNQQILNPAVLNVAGRPASPYAVVHHVGRRSGRSYATPVRVRPTPEGFILPLPYGSDVDWCRNVLAAGGCTILWHGNDYAVGEPAVMDLATVLALVPLPRWRSQVWSGLIARSPLKSVPYLWVKQLSVKSSAFTGASLTLQEQLEAFRSTHPIKHFTVNGATGDYLVGGTGEETLVLLTGGTNSNELLFQIISAFEPQYRVIAPRYPSVRTMAEVIGWLLALLDAEGVQHAHVLGESYGGMVAQCLVRRAPSRVSSLILVSTLAPVKPLPLRPRLQKLLVMLLPWRMVLPFSQRLMRPALAHTPFPEEERAFWTATVIEQIGRVSKHWLINSYRNSEDYSEHYHFAPEDLAAWPGAVLIIGSDADEALQRYRPYAIPLTTLYPRAQVHIFHGAGHVPPFTRREEYIEVLRRFLTQRSSAVGARGSETSPAASLS